MITRPQHTCRVVSWAQLIAFIQKLDFAYFLKNIYKLKEKILEVYQPPTTCSFHAKLETEAFYRS